jgi:hypothetical protein
MPTVCTLLVAMKSNNNNNTAMGSVHARGDTFLTFGLKALTETNTSRLATDLHTFIFSIALCLTLWSRSSSKYLRFQSVPQREHHTSPLQKLTS